jgi:hypothetical protein
MKVLMENLYDIGTKYAEQVDSTVRGVGSILLEAHDTIEDLLEEKKELQAKLNVITRSGVGDKEKVLEELKRQNSILTEVRNLQEILGFGKKKDKEVEPQKGKAQLMMLVQRYLQASNAQEKLNAIAGIALISADPSLASRAVKLSRAGTGSVITGTEDE